MIFMDMVFILGTSEHDLYNNNNNNNNYNIIIIINNSSKNK